MRMGKREPPQKLEIELSKAAFHPFLLFSPQGGSFEALDDSSSLFARSSIYRVHGQTMSLHGIFFFLALEKFLLREFSFSYLHIKRPNNTIKAYQK